MIFHPGEHGFRISRGNCGCTGGIVEEEGEDEAVNQWKTICQTFRAHPTLEWQLFTFRFPWTFVRTLEILRSLNKKKKRGEGEEKEKENKERRERGKKGERRWSSWIKTGRWLQKVGESVWLCRQLGKGWKITASCSPSHFAFTYPICFPRILCRFGRSHSVDFRPSRKIGPVTSWLSSAETFEALSRNKAITVIDLIT